MVKITDEIREAARQLLLHRHDAADVARLKAIADGKRKLIDWNWWRMFYADFDRAKRDKIAALADPARNDKEHERKVAAAKLAALKARRPPGSMPDPPPMPRTAEEWLRRRKIKTPAKRSSQQSSLKRKLSDSVATAHASDSVASVKQTSDSVARLEALNKRRAAQRAASRASLKCQSCGKPLTAAQRATARYCNATCRSHAWRKIERARAV